jgi:hypothetical protein
MTKNGSEDKGWMSRLGLRYLTIGRRTYRKTSSRDRRRKLEYSTLELRVANLWLADAGFQQGDIVAVSSPRPGMLVASRLGTRDEELGELIS